MLQDEYKKGSSKAKNDRSIVLVAYVVDSIESKACKDW